MKHIPLIPIQPVASAMIANPIERALNDILLLLKNWRLFPIAFQAATLVIFGWAIASLCQTGLTSFSMQNPGMALIWQWWWPAIPFLIFITGHLCCTVCPFASVSAMISRVIPKSRFGNQALIKKGAITGFALFSALMVMDILFGISNSPRLTSWILLGLLCLAIVFTLLFDRNTYCSTLCPYGFLARIYARVAFLRINRNKTVCMSCHRNNQDGRTSISGTWKDDVECLNRCRHGAAQIAFKKPWASAPDQNSIGMTEALLPASMLIMLATHIFSAGNYVRYGYALFTSYVPINVSLFVMLAIVSIILLHTAFALAVTHLISGCLCKSRNAPLTVFISVTPLLLFFHMALVKKEFGGGAPQVGSITGPQSYYVALILLGGGIFMAHMSFTNLQRGADLRTKNSPAVSLIFYTIVSIYIAIALMTIRYLQYFGC